MADQALPATPWPFPEIALPPWIELRGTYPTNLSPHGRNTVAILLEPSAGRVLLDPDIYAITQFALLFDPSTPWRQTLRSCCNHDDEQVERIASKFLRERQFLDTMRGAQP